MSTFLLVGYVKHFDTIKRYRLKRDMPWHERESAIALNCGLWGVWCGVRDQNALVLKDDTRLPVHIAILKTPGRVIGERASDAANAHRWAHEWRESFDTAEQARVRLTCEHEQHYTRTERPAVPAEPIAPHGLVNSPKLDALVRARQSANRKMMTYITGMQAAENDARSSDARWNEKWADYWKGRRDGLREAIAMIGPNEKSSDAREGGK